MSTARFRAEYCRKRRSRLRELGLCVDCGVNHTSEFSRCEECRRRQSTEGCERSRSRTLKARYEKKTEAMMALIDRMDKLRKGIA